MGIGCLSGTYGRRGMALPHTHLVSRLMKDCRYLYSLLGLHGLFLKFVFYLEVNNHTVHGAVWETWSIYCENHTKKYTNYAGKMQNFKWGGTYSNRCSKVSAGHPSNTAHLHATNGKLLLDPGHSLLLPARIIKGAILKYNQCRSVLTAA